jgi:signal transduction histidine kinase
LTQIGGGPQAPENNLVRFGLPAIFWAILLAVAWNRQRHQDLPRERLLVWGFGLALFRELFMLLHLSEKLLDQSGHAAHSSYVEPIEHALAVAAVIVISAAFLRYILDDAWLPRRYLIIGLGAVAAGFLLTFFWWPEQLAINPEIRFNETAPAWLLHFTELLLIASAMFILIQKRGWLRNVVLIALSFLFLSEFLIIVNFITGRAHAAFLCPISNNLHIWAVPIFGLVYFREQAIEKRHAQNELRSYRDHLQELVDDRTVELRQANKQLQRAAVLEERQRIAANMHDGLAQTLSTLSLKTGQAAELLNEGDVQPVLNEFDQMQDIIGRAVSDIRRSIASLQENPQPRLSLQDALARTIGDIAKRKNGPEPDFDKLQEPIFLAADEQEQVLRLVQEALLNARRHASATFIKLRLERKPGQFIITVEDDGLGFDLEQAEQNNGNHFGLSIMRARASHIGGNITIDSRPGHGTRVTLTWPANGAGTRESSGHTLAEELFSMKTG